MRGLVACIVRMDPKSRDLRCAREAAEHPGIERVEADIPALAANHVVQVIEMPHKAQAEIGQACPLLAERIHSEGLKVTNAGVEGRLPFCDPTRFYRVAVRKRSSRPQSTTFPGTPRLD
ncbi:hypothetical protein [Nonomuraea insulae]|uniref:Uncharacterized protein n=1 Tax=Nonomuraea insulae TaxID=1616787 RepID=A0ABW1DCM9_9ACTN